jgi:hypothetical protein
MTHPTEPTTNTPPEADPVPEPARNPFRVTLATIMVGVLAAAAGAAMVVRIHRIFDGVSGGLAYDLPALVLIAVVSTVFALGSWRGTTLTAMLLQIAVCCGLVAGLFELAEVVPRVYRYTFQIGFALLIALPMVARRLAGALPEGRQRTILAIADVLLSCGAILMLVWVGMLLQIIFMQW